MASGGGRLTTAGKLLPFILIAALLFGCARKEILRGEAPYPPPPTPEAPAPPKEPVAERAREPVPEPVPEKDPFEGVPRKYRLKAVEGEKNREWGKALLAWKVVHALAPTDLQARSQMESLKARVTGEADRHFRRGVELFERNAKQPAGKEMAAALAYQPEHKGAREYLGRICTEPDGFEYQTVEGDTAAEISRKIYK